MQKHYCLRVLLALLLVCGSASQNFPQFVTKVVEHDDSKDQPTFSDVDLFMDSTFAVGNSYLAVDTNSTAAFQMSNAFLENSKLPPRLDCYRPNHCADIQLCGKARNGIHRIYPFGVGEGFLVMCDMDTLGGGWTVVHRRMDGSQNFSRGWNDYMAGFGNLLTEFWIGLHRLHQLTSACQTELAVQMSDFNGDYAWAKYEHFYVSDEANKFRLFVRGYGGTAGDSLQLHSGMMFSTPDADNDVAIGRHCAQNYGCGWWFGKCANANLNGMYSNRFEGNEQSLRNIMWYTWKKRAPLQWAEMRIRPAQFNSACSDIK